MGFAKRIILFLVLNFLVILMISFVFNLLGLRPYLNAYGLDYQSLLIFCAIWGMGGALISLALSKVMAKWMMKVKIIKPNTHDPEEAKILNAVHSLCRDAGLAHMPEVGIFRSPEPNAFATGPTQARSLVAVSTGLLERMDFEEVKGVLGHEVSHIANGDMVTMTLLQGVINAFVMFLARVLAYILSGMGRGRQGGRGGSFGSFILFTWVFEIIFMILGSLVVCAYSRYREFRADAGGARLAGKDSMIGALKALQANQRIKDPKADNSAIAAFKIARPEGKKGWLHLFMTHPPLDKRIKRLEEGGY
jgi:heat shock protein HtpX